MAPDDGARLEVARQLGEFVGALHAIEPERARTAVVVNIIGKRGLQNAMALSMGGMNATRILGPTLSGFMVPILGLAGAFSIGVALYVVALLCLLGVDRCPPSGASPSPSSGRLLATKVPAPVRATT